MTTIIRTIKDLDSLQFGESYIIDPGDFPEDPEELIKSDAWAKAEEIAVAAEKLFTSTEPKPDPDRPTDPQLDEQDSFVTVRADGADHVVINSKIQTSALAGGDIRDGSINLKVGDNRRALQKNREGWISINSVKFEY